MSGFFADSRLYNQSMDLSTITNPEALRLAKVFFTYRGINRKFFELVPEEQFDFRMVDTKNRKSDSPRESLAHLIEIESSYLLGAGDGLGNQWGRAKRPELKTQSKEYLLAELAKKDQELIAFLADNKNLEKTVQVKWSDKQVTVLSYLWAMNDHEILHNGWNLAMMDVLDIPRFEELVQIWG